MSQLPPTPPNSFPPPYYPYGAAWAQAPDPSAPAKRAGILMIILGVLCLLLGGCMGLMASVLPTMSDNPEVAQMIQQFEEQAKVDAFSVFLAVAVVLTVAALAQIVVGVLVRRGTLGPVITGIVLTSLLLLFMGLQTVGALITPGGLPGACVMGAITALYVVLLIWLIQAIRNAASVGATPMPFGYPPPYGYPGTQPYPPHGYGYGYGYGYAPPPVETGPAPDVPTPPSAASPPSQDRSE